MKGIVHERHEKHERRHSFFLSTVAEEFFSCLSCFSWTGFFVHNISD